MRSQRLVWVLRMDIPKGKTEWGEGRNEDHISLGCCLEEEIEVASGQNQSPRGRKLNKSYWDKGSSWNRWAFPLTFMKNSLTTKCSKLGEGFRAILEKRKEAKSMTPRLLTLLLKNGRTENVRHRRFLTLLNSGFKTRVGIAWGGQQSWLTEWSMRAQTL